MRIVVIGATGHVGSYLIPRLVEAGHEVVALSRGERAPYVAHAAWDRVEQVAVDRAVEDAAGTFGRRIADLGADVVVDLICFTAASAGQLVDALAGGTVRHLLHCGTIWVHGLSTELPIREDDPKVPIGDYGTQKQAIAELLLGRGDNDGPPATVIHPGHISGPGWPVINPLGNLDPAVWTALATGQPLQVPGLGAETMHHVHADDVAQVFQLAIERPQVAVGQAFHAVAERAMSVRGYAEAAAGWFDQVARLDQVSWHEFREQTSEAYATSSWEHLSRSHVMSIDKARQLLGYRPAHTAEETAREAVAWMVKAGEVDVLPPDGLPR